MKKDLNALQVVSASSLMAGALQAALIQTLIRKNLISARQGREIYEQALLLLGKDDHAVEARQRLGVQAINRGADALPEPEA